MRDVTVRCDNCATPRPAQRPKTWWLLEDQGEVMRTGPVDVCSFACLEQWLADPEIRALYAADWEMPRRSFPRPVRRWLLVMTRGLMRWGA